MKKMKIEREINGNYLEFELTEYEMYEAYLSYKNHVNAVEVRNYLYDFGSMDILSICNFTSPSHKILTEDAVYQAVEAIYQNEELLLSIFERLEASNSSDPYEDQMHYFIEVGLRKFGEENPCFLKQFEK